MNWDKWPTSIVDYDFYILDKLPDGRYPPPTIVGDCLSEGMQNGSQAPTEFIDCVVHFPGTYYIYIVDKMEGPEKPKIKIFSWRHNISPAQAASSIVSPGDAISALTVGAIHQSNWTFGSQSENSSQGPTMNGDIKPDIMGPDEIYQNFSWPPYDNLSNFRGTSAAAPHVAGAAALILSSHGYQLTQLRTALTNYAIDMGSFGKDNIYGSGRLKMPYLYILQIYHAGTGSGTVQYSSAGSSCGSNCNEYYSNTQVTLTAVPSVGSALTGWSGCDSVSTNKCTVLMSKASNVTASFAKTYNLTVSTTGGTGSGTVTSTSDSGISCGADCSETFVENTIVKLTAAPDVNSYFAGWSGACSGTETCEITMNDTRQVTAKFTSCNLQVNVISSIGGFVTSSPYGIACPGDCNETYPRDSIVSLTPHPPSYPYSAFTGWGGACSGVGACSVQMSTEKSVWASFGKCYTIDPISLSMSARLNSWVRRDITIINKCGQNLAINDIRLLSNPYNVFSIVYRPPSIIYPGSGGRISVQFVPFTSTMTINGIMRIYLNDPAQPYVDVYLAGRGSIYY